MPTAAQNDSTQTHAIHCERVRVVYPAHTMSRRERHAQKGKSTTEAVVAVNDVSLAIEPGERVCLLGPNGSGKSSLMRVLAGLQRQTSGSVTVFGHHANSSGAAARRGVAFQSVSLDGLLTVRENLLLFAAGCGLDAHESAQQIERLAGQMAFADRLGHRVGTLSGGFARRVDCARAMLARPSLVLLDEPTGGLDPASRGMFFDEIDVAGNADDRPAVLLCTHLLEEAAWADRLVFMHNGTVASDSTLARLHETYGENVLRLTWRTDAIGAGAGAYVAQHSLAGRARSTSARRVIVPLVAIDDGAAHASALASMDVDVALGRMTLADIYEIVTGEPLSGGAA